MSPRWSASSLVRAHRRCEHDEGEGDDEASDRCTHRGLLSIGDGGSPPGHRTAGSLNRGTGCPTVGADRNVERAVREAIEIQVDHPEVVEQAEDTADRTWYGIDGPRRRPRTEVSADASAPVIAPPSVEAEPVLVVPEAAPPSEPPIRDARPSGIAGARSREERSRERATERPITQEHPDAGAAPTANSRNGSTCCASRCRPELGRRIDAALARMEGTFEREIEALRTANREEAKRFRSSNGEAFVRIRAADTQELERIRRAIDEGIERLCSVLEGQLDRVWSANDVELERIRSAGADRLAEVHDLLTRPVGASADGATADRRRPRPSRPGAPAALDAQSPERCDRRRSSEGQGAGRADDQQEPVRVDRRAVARMPLEVVVRAARVAGRADVADHVARLDRSELSEPRQVRVVDVAEVAEHLDRETTDVVRRRDGHAVERRDDRDAHRREMSLPWWMWSPPWFFGWWTMIPKSSAIAWGPASGHTEKGRIFEISYWICSTRSRSPATSRFDWAIVLRSSS